MGICFPPAIETWPKRWPFRLELVEVDVVDAAAFVLSTFCRKL
jgi:hypothetical protein